LSGSTAHGRAEQALLPYTRKYLGSKRQLKDWLAETMCTRAGTPRSFLDGFCGTGAVGIAMARRGAQRIVAVDSLRSNCAILRGFTRTSRRAPELMRWLTALPPVQGYISESYAGTYFTGSNCARMDAVREGISVLAAREEITHEEHDILLASFLLAADRVANTLGQYDAFMKNIAGSGRAGGRHVVDERVQTPFALRPLEPLPGRLDVIEADMLEAAGEIEVDIAYLDPPYNHRQYCDNYHVLENLARWEKPRLSGKTRKFDRTGMKSPFSKRIGAAEALRKLVPMIRAPHVFLSYSSEGILMKQEIEAILSSRGRVWCAEIPYPVFGNGAGVSTRRTVTEYLFHLAVQG
jgi:adenine-specific DNA-methyltransferase